MECCETEGTSRFFSRWSKTYWKRFRKKGLAKEQRYLVEGIMKHPLETKTILEIGSGVGGLLLTLLQQGAATALGVDMSEGMIEKARQLANEMRFDTRARYLVGDFVTMNGEIPPSEITILDKVVCCYDDVEKLVRRSLAKTKELYALSFPRDYLLVRSIFKTHIFISTLFRFSFRPYWHDWEQMCEQILSSGFDEVYRNKTLFWTIHVYRKRS